MEGDQIAKLAAPRFCLKLAPTCLCKEAAILRQPLATLLEDEGFSVFTGLMLVPLIVHAARLHQPAADALRQAGARQEEVALLCCIHIEQSQQGGSGHKG